MRPDRRVLTSERKTLMTTLTRPYTTANATLRALRRFNTAMTTRHPGQGIATLAPAGSFLSLNPTTEKLGLFRRVPAYLSRRCGSIGVDR